MPSRTTVLPRAGSEGNHWGLVVFPEAALGWSLAADTLAATSQQAGNVTVR